jgi:hypothetical protein
MATPPNIPSQLLTGEVVDIKTGRWTTFFQRNFQTYLQKIDAAITNLYEIADSAKIQGRTEGIGTTVQHVDQVGQLQPAGVGFTVDAVPNGSTYARTTPVQVTGAGRAAVAIDASNNVTSEHVVPAIQLNFSAQATVTPNDAGASAEVDVYGSGGPGTQWFGELNGAAAGPYPSFSVSGLSYLTTYIAYYDTVNAIGVIRTVPATEDYFVYAGTFKTPASGGGSVATAVAIMAGVAPNETVQSVNITSGGSGYTSAPSVTFNGGGTPSTVATGVATINGSGQVTSVVMTNSGAGYNATPTISFSGGQGGVSGGGGSTGTVGGRGSLAGVLSQ